MPSGWVYGKVKGIPTSTTCDMEVIENSQTSPQTKESGEDYWEYSITLEPGDYSIKAVDTTAGAGGNNETKTIEIETHVAKRLDFDIS